MKGFLLEDCSQDEIVEQKLYPAAYCGQVHSTEIKYVSHGGLYEQCDGLITDLPGLNLVIRTADCNAVVFECSSPAWVMNLHVGWRGAALGIVEKGIDLFCSKGCRPADINVTVFPGMRECCFEVKEDLVQSAGEGMRLFVSERDGKLYLDLAGYIKQILIDSEICNIVIDERCSCCTSGFASYRRDGTVKRNCGFVRI